MALGRNQVPVGKQDTPEPRAQLCDHASTRKKAGLTVLSQQQTKWGGQLVLLFLGFS